MTRNNDWDHDSDDPLGYLNGIEVAWLSADSTVELCAHCRPATTPLPMSGNAWGLALTHEDHCPENVENQPDPIRPA